MQCNPELVSAFIDGELEDILVEPVVNHLTVCTQCRQMLSALANARDAVVEKFALPDTESVPLSVMSAIRNGQVVKSGGREGLAVGGGSNGLASAMLKRLHLRRG